MTSVYVHCKKLPYIWAFSNNCYHTFHLVLPSDTINTIPVVKGTGKQNHAWLADSASWESCSLITGRNHTPSCVLCVVHLSLVLKFYLGDKRQWGMYNMGKTFLHKQTLGATWAPTSKCLMSPVWWYAGRPRPLPAGTNASKTLAVGQPEDQKADENLLNSWDIPGPSGKTSGGRSQVHPAPGYESHASTGLHQTHQKQS